MKKIIKRFFIPMLLLAASAVIMIQQMDAFGEQELQGGEHHQVSTLQGLSQFLFEFAIDEAMNVPFTMEDKLELINREGQPVNAYLEDFDHLISALEIGFPRFYVIAKHAVEARELLEAFYNVNDAVFSTFIMRELYSGFLQPLGLLWMPIPLDAIEEHFGGVYGAILAWELGDVSYTVLPSTTIVFFYPTK